MSDGEPRRNRDAPWFHDSLFSFLRSLPAVHRRFWILVVGVGLAAGVGAALLIQLLHVVESLAWPPGADLLARVEASPPWARVLVPAAAGLLVSIVTYAARAPLSGHGTSGILEAVWGGSPKLSLPRALVRGVVIIVVVGMGAPLGREGALLSTGAGFGSFAGQRARLHPDQIRVLMACGAAAGIAAAYNVPIGGALFGLEVILGSFALELFGPVVVSCVVATLVSRTLVSSHAAYQIPEYHLGSPRELATILLVAPVLGVASALYVHVIERLSVLRDRAPAFLRPALPPIVMAAVGALAIPFPQILGNGYEAVDLALRAALPLSLLLVLPLLKLLATATVSGSGVPGGLFTPTLFFGALLGGALGTAVHAVWSGAPPVGAFALVGMAAALAGTTHASLASVLIIFEMTRDYGVVLPLLVACFLAVTISRAIEPHSLYTGILHRRGARLPMAALPGWMAETTVESLVRPHPETLSPATPFAPIAVRLLDLPWGVDLHVVDERGHWLGTVSLSALKAHLPDQAELAMVVAQDVMDPRIEPLSPLTSLREARRRLAAIAVEELPVVDAEGRLLGTVSRRDLLGTSEPRDPSTAAAALR